MPPCLHLLVREAEQGISKFFPSMKYVYYVSSAFRRRPGESQKTNGQQTPSMSACEGWVAGERQMVGHKEKAGDGQQVKHQASVQSQPNGDQSKPAKLNTDYTY